MLNNEKGLYYLQSRYYDPSVRRFINADKFEIIGKTDFLSSYNLYVYCDNSPIGKSDAKGNAATKWVGVGVQFQISTKSYSIGIEIICFGDKTICEKNHVTKAYAYAFYSGNTNGNAETIWKYGINMRQKPRSLLRG